MRYIGNKTRLLDFIGGVLLERGISSGVAVDPFTGTASVARMLKQRGFRVVASDLMEYGHVFARAYVQVAQAPDLTTLAGQTGENDTTLRAVARYLDRLPQAPGFVCDQFSPTGRVGRRHGRMYFTPENAARIDAIRTTIDEWRRRDWIDDDAFHLLLAALIEAADRVANTTGVYAAFVKSWQPNALRPLHLRAPEIVAGNGCHARRADALDTVRDAGTFDLLYLDPPYNTRQYAGYYHIPELIARGWFDGDVRTRGKTGLLDDDDRRSDWSSAVRCGAAFETLVANADCRHVVMSYNAEGIIPEATIERVFREYGAADTYRRYEHAYRRYRSDADGPRRRYRGDSVHEYLYCVRR